MYLNFCFRLGYFLSHKLIHFPHFLFNQVLDSENIFPRKLTPEVLQALRGVRFIAQHIKDADKDNEVQLFALE